MNVFKAFGSTRNSSNSRDISAGRLHGLQEPAGTDWRKERLAAAASKYGRPFKCAGEDMLREVFVGGGELVTVSAGAKPGSDKGADTRPAPTFPKRRPRVTVLHGN